MKWWFAQEVGLFEKQDKVQNSKRGNVNQMPFWMDADFVKDEPVEED